MFAFSMPGCFEGILDNERKVVEYDVSIQQNCSPNTHALKGCDPKHNEKNIIANVRKH